MACDLRLWEACRKWNLCRAGEETSGQSILPVSSFEVFQKMCLFLDGDHEVPTCLLGPGETSSRCIWLTLSCLKNNMGWQFCIFVSMGLKQLPVFSLFWSKIFEMVKNSVWGNRSWQFCGKRISARCLSALIGIRPQRLGTAGKGKLDLRYRCFGAETWLDVVCDLLVQESHVTNLNNVVWVYIICGYMWFVFLVAIPVWSQGEETKTFEIHANWPVFFEALHTARGHAAHTVPCVQNTSMPFKMFNCI